MRTAVLAHVVSVTEYERGWGQRPDGYHLFNSRDKAEAWIKNQYKGRSGPVPDCYESYDYSGEREIGLTCKVALQDRGDGVWVSSLK